ncbi:hypothetical protein E2C01_069033 [Portunus trituberculatus]|uniref:Uncharacterized protein n=1 Tax=Portunus trituberculatus TaxID=210409 RepID=A0A5B7HXI6_PORTR|nr:hypothetical protein [Portunus trituberculatus]
MQYRLLHRASAEMENETGEQSVGRDSWREQTGLTQEDLVDAESGDQPCTSKQPGLEQSGARQLAVVVV